MKTKIQLNDTQITITSHNKREEKVITIFKLDVDLLKKYQNSDFDTLQIKMDKMKAVLDVMFHLEMIAEPVSIIIDYVEHKRIVKFY